MAKAIDIFDRIILTENVYIYKKPSKKFYSKNTIHGLFTIAKDEKHDQACTKLFSLINQTGVSLNGRDYRISGLVLKYYANASFIDEPINGWEEVKLAYLFLIDFKDYLVISKRNISGIGDFTDTLDPLEYEVISKMLYTNQSTFEKYGMDNLDSAGVAMKARVVVADNLEESFNYGGANTYMLNSLRISNDLDRYAISTSTSRLSKSGDKSKLIPFVNWSAEIIELATNFTDKDTPLDVFAKPYDYIAERDNLTAISVTLLFNRILEDIDNGIITEIRFQDRHFRTRRVDIKKHLRDLSQYLPLEPTGEDYRYEVPFGVKSFYRDLSIKMNPKSIVLHSSRLRRLRLYKNDGTNLSFIEYLSGRNCFIIGFDQCEFKYNSRKLFKDSMLLGAINPFLSVFEPDANTIQITCEKGIPKANSTIFDTNSAFFFAENKFTNSDFLVLDDLGGEWADHIYINGLEIGFVHSKANNSLFSATAFTEIIGQAQKNLGSLNATEKQIRSKTQLWQGNYRLNNINTQITRLRKGQNVNAFINRFIEIKSNINTQKAVHLVVNFISKAELTINLNNLRNGVDFARKREAIQILWQISSLISSCREHNVRLKIHCRP